MAERLSVGTALSRSLRRFLQISHSPMAIAPARKMHGQFGRDLSHVFAIALLEPLADPPMQTSAPACWHPLVPHLLLQCVAKLVARRHCPVRPLTDPGRP